MVKEALTKAVPKLERSISDWILRTQHMSYYHLDLIGIMWVSIIFELPTFCVCLIVLCIFIAQWTGLGL